jgi:hypothetical protein
MNNFDAASDGQYFPSGQRLVAPAGVDQCQPVVALDQEGVCTIADYTVF